MTGDDRREPLWASSLAEEEPRPDYDAVFEFEEPAAPEEVVEPSPLPWIAVILLTALVMVGVTLALSDRSTLVVQDVPSFWGSIPMNCHTARLTQQGNAVELFRCHATDGETLPPGRYRSPDAQWNSDLTGEASLASIMVISPEGELRGWAAY